MREDVEPLTEAERDAAIRVINAAAKQYEGVIPAESYAEPYMSPADFEAAMAEMTFYGVYRGRLVGLIGCQERDGVSLIRHLYVHPEHQGGGIGTCLLETALTEAASSTVLVGTWADADWAVAFYEANGFRNLGTDRDLLETYWDVPDHQVDASVVLRYDRA